MLPRSRASRSALATKNPSPPLALTRFARTTVRVLPMEGLSTPRRMPEWRTPNHHVSHDHVGATLLDGDPLAASENAVGGDDVSAAGADDDAGPAVADAAVTPHLVAIGL